MDVEHVRVVAADSDLCPVDLGAYSSRVTFMVGNAAIDAARKLRKKVVTAVAEAWEVEERRVRLIEGRGDRPRGRRARPEHARGLRDRGGPLRHPRRDGLLQHPHPRRRLPGRHDRSVAGVLLHGAHRRGRRRRGDRTDHRAEGVVRPRLRPRPQPAPGGRPDRGLGLHGHRRGAARGPQGQPLRPAQRARRSWTTGSRPPSTRPTSRPSSSRASTPRAPTERRRPARVRCTRRSRRSPTRSTTPSASVSASSRSPRPRSSPRCARSASARCRRRAAARPWIATEGR